MGSAGPVGRRLRCFLWPWVKSNFPQTLRRCVPFPWCWHLHRWHKATVGGVVRLTTAMAPSCTAVTMFSTTKHYASPNPVSRNNVLPDDTCTLSTHLKTLCVVKWEVYRMCFCYIHWSLKEKHLSLNCKQNTIFLERLIDKPWLFRLEYELLDANPHYRKSSITLKRIWESWD